MLGNTLRTAREARDLPLREVEWATKINADYLQALEDENFSALPAATYARGFLRTYAKYLDLDPEPLIEEFNQASSGATTIVSTRPSVTFERQRVTLTPGAIVTGVMLLLALAFGLYIKGQIDTFEASKRAAAQSTPPTHLAPLPTPSPSPSPGASPSPRVYTGVEVVLRFDAPTWVRVDIDGKASDMTGAGGKVYDAGASMTFTGNTVIHVRSGKAIHTFVTFNGKDLGAMATTEGSTVGDKTYNKGGTVT